MKLKKKKERKHIKKLPHGVSLKLFHNFKKKEGVNLNYSAVNVFTFTNNKTTSRRISY